MELSLPLDPEREKVWASQAQIVELFGVDQSGVSRHVRNIFKGAEIDRESNMQKVHIGSSNRPVTLYSLDVILAVGYRANSARAMEKAEGEYEKYWALADSPPSDVERAYLDAVKRAQHRLEEGESS